MLYSYNKARENIKKIVRENISTVLYYKIMSITGPMQFKHVFCSRVNCI